jgi:hypothetical protein
LVPKNAPPRSGRPNGRGEKSTYKKRVHAIAMQRERAMADLRSLDCQNPAPGSFVNKAQTLLTLGWSKANWRSRASIIRTVGWLLHLEHAHRTRRAEGADGAVRSRQTEVPHDNNGDHSMVPVGRFVGDHPDRTASQRWSAATAVAPE